MGGLGGVGGGLVCGFFSDCLEYCVEEFELGGGYACGFSAAEGFSPDGLYFYGFAFEVVDEAGGFVVFHGVGDVDLFLDELLGDGVAFGCGGGLYFVHECVDLICEGLVGEDLPAVDSAGGDGEAVEGDVPD